MYAFHGRSSDLAVLWVCEASTPALISILMLVGHVVQLLHRLSIRGVNGPEKLLKVIKVRTNS